MARFEVLVTASYAGLSALWIAGSDQAVARLFPARVTEIQTYKGWLFVAVTALLLYLAVRQYRIFRQGVEDVLRTEAAVRSEMIATLQRAKREAERADRAKSKFLAAASHDLRQPAHSLVLLFAALRERLCRYGDDRPAQAALDGMQQSLDALRLLLDGLLDVSRLDAGLVVPQVTAVELQPLLARLQAECAPRAAACGLALRAVATSAVGRSDAVLLERMLRNLIDNALKFTRHGGVVIGCRNRGDRVLVEVADSGDGILPEHQHEIFDEYFQVGNPGRDRAKGLGLGLAVVSRLGRLLGQGVGLRSRPGRGSRFHVELPRAGGAERRHGAACPGPAPSCRPHVGEEAADGRPQRAGLL
ncbi:MAG: HAMP domain-containing histidine kinase [Magnetospirillum sp.]|nr:HAMP domain-containing histidine kinase [Magnetospirillum sp.]